jgi:two-component sensor histidine kinase
MVELLARELDLARKDGFAGTLWCRDAFPLDASPHCGEIFFEQERRLNSWLADKPCSVFCFNYNRELDSPFLLELFNVHPIVVFNRARYDNIFARVGENNNLGPGAVLSHRMQTLVRHARLVSEREKLDAILQEKEFLLREVHHRVINNLQIVNSLLDLQTIQADNVECAQILAEARSKIYSIALIHTQLYQSERFDRINMVSYLRDLALYLLHIFSSPKRRVIPHYELEEFFLPVTQAIPFAIIVTELLSNTLKHAFPGRAEGEVTLSAKISGDKTINFELKDNGVGFSAPGDKCPGVGINIIQNIARAQLQGNITFVSEAGTTARLVFPVA